MSEHAIHQFYHHFILKLHFATYRQSEILNVENYKKLFYIENIYFDFSAS